MATKGEKSWGITPLKPTKDLEVEQNSDGWKKLRLSAQEINRIAQELENAILEFKAIANHLKSTSQVDGSKVKLPVVYAPISMPWVVNKANKSFVLTTRRIDLFRAERDAANLAASLRWQNLRKSSSNSK